MNKQKLTDTNIKSLMDKLGSKDVATRLKARKSLTSLGKPAVLSLSRALNNSKLDHLRWEAAKTLGAIGDIRSIPSLVKALDDSNIDVEWLAAKALKKFKKNAWPELLHALIKSEEDSVSLRHGAHHVLKNQKEAGFKDLLTNLLVALKSSMAPEMTAIAANEILKQMKVKSSAIIIRK